MDVVSVTNMVKGTFCTYAEPQSTPDTQNTKHCHSFMYTHILYIRTNTHTHIRTHTHSTCTHLIIVKLAIILIYNLSANSTNRKLNQLHIL